MEYKFIIDQKEKQDIYWENFIGNRKVSLNNGGELMIQDVFNEKKLIKLEVHTEDTTRRFIGINENIVHTKQSGYDLKFVVP